MTRNEYSNTNASLFFALLICFFIGIHSFVKFKLSNDGYEKLLQPGQFYISGFVAHGGDDFLHQVGSPKLQRSGVDAGVDTDIVSREHILVDQQLYPVFLIIHKTQYTQRTGGDVQETLHILAISEA